MNEVKDDAVEQMPHSIRKKVWSVFTTLVTVTLVVLAIYCCIGVAHQAETGRLFFPFGYRPVKILSGSMEDTLKTGAVVIVKKTQDVQEGDIIFFIAEDETPVIHRYVDTDENGNMITKGDANPKEDWDPITLDQIQGKVVAVMNWLSWLG